MEIDTIKFIGIFGIVISIFPIFMGGLLFFVPLFTRGGSYIFFVPGAMFYFMYKHWDEVRSGFWILFYGAIFLLLSIGWIKHFA